MHGKHLPDDLRPVRVGVIDSGIGTGESAAGQRVVAACAFSRAMTGEITPLAPHDDLLGHGSEVATLIRLNAAHTEFVDAQVFSTARAIDAGVLAAAIDWCVEHAVRVVNLSLGLRADRRLLRDACARASAAGLTLVAATPARGGDTFPAAYPQVIAVSGDARCVDGGWSWLGDGLRAGASPRPPRPAAGGGASYAAARLTGVAAAFFAQQPAAKQADLLVHLRTGASLVGRECRT